MPPSPKFTKEEILDAAVEIVKAYGADALTARSLAARLGSSSRPIFTVYPNMDELRADVIRRAKAIYSEYVTRGLEQRPAFRGVGMEYIRFARENRMLFKLLFMSEISDALHIDGVLEVIDDSYERILGSIVDGYGLSREVADGLYRHLWIYSHGIALLLVTGVCEFTDAEAEGMLTVVFKGLLSSIKAGVK